MGFEKVEENEKCELWKFDRRIWKRINKKGFLRFCGGENEISQRVKKWDKQRGRLV